jgi:hypothetical protein
MLTLGLGKSGSCSRLGTKIELAKKKFESNLYSRYIYRVNIVP